MPQGEVVLSYLAPASSLLFHPRSQTVEVVANQCQPRVATVHGHKGRVVTGQIIPALQDVRVLMEVVEEGVTSLLEALSDEKGFYAFSAIEPSAEFISWVWDDGGLTTLAGGGARGSRVPQVRRRPELLAPEAVFAHRARG